MRKTFITLSLVLLSASLVSSFTIRRLPDALVNPEMTNPIDTQIKQVLKSKASLPQMQELLTNNLLQTTPANRVYKLFQRLISEVNQEQLTMDNVKESQEKDCTDEIDYRKKHISEASTAIGKATEAKGKCEVSLTRAQSLLSINEQIQDFKSKELQALKDIRDTENKIFVHRSKKNQRWLDSIDQALELVGQLEGKKKPDGGQVSNVTKSLIQLYTNSREPLVNAVIQEMTILLAQDPAKSSGKENNVAKVREFLVDLRKRIAERFEHATSQENAAMEEFQEQSKLIGDLREELSQQEHTLKVLIAEMEECSSEEGSILAMNTQRKTRNERLLEAAQAMCNAFSVEFEVGSRSRSESIQLYNKILEWLKDYFKKNPEASVPDTSPPKKKTVASSQ